MLPILILLFFFGVIGGMGFLVYKKMQETSVEAFDTSTKDDIETAQEFLPFDEIKDGMVSLGGHRYRLYIEISSINYHLRTSQEKEMIDSSYQAFLNSLSSPTTIFIQTRKIDTSKMAKSLSEDIKNAIQEFPAMEGYATQYFDEMVALTDHIGNNRQKKKFLIVSYDEASILEGLSNQEKYEYAAKEIYNQALMIMDGLTPIGLQSKILNTKEVAELIYSVYHRDSHGHVENIVNGEYMTLMVESEKDYLNKTDEGRLDWILYETQMKIQTNLSDAGLDSHTRKQMEESLKMLNDIRDKHAGYYSNKDEANYELQEIDEDIITKSSFEI